MELIDEVNNTCKLSFKQYEKLTNLKLNEKYKILNIEKIKFKYGDSIVVELEEFKVFLPKRVLSVMDDKTIGEYNKIDNLCLIVSDIKKFKDKDTAIFEFSVL